jgi:hypothetical protein
MPKTKKKKEEKWREEAEYIIAHRAGSSAREEGFLVDEGW